MTEPDRPVPLHDGSASSSAIIMSRRRFGRRDFCEPSNRSEGLDLGPSDSLTRTI